MKNFNIQDDQKIMSILKLTEIRHMLAHTNVGDLTLLLRKGEKEYTFCLDAVPVDKEQQRELSDIYFPKQTMPISTFPERDAIPTVPHPKGKRTNLVPAIEGKILVKNSTKPEKK